MLLNNWNLILQIAYRLPVPSALEVKTYTMNNEQDIDNHKQMVRIPERIETSEPIKRFRQLNEISPEPFCCKSKCYCHQNHHQNSCHTFNPFNEVSVTGSMITKYAIQIRLIIFFRRNYMSRKITSKVIPGMKYNTDHYCRRNCLHASITKLYILH